MLKKLGQAIVGFVVVAGAMGCFAAKQTGMKKQPGIWQATPIVADGKADDWPGAYAHYDEDAMLGYSITNDSVNIYLRIETGDLGTQLKILEQGLTVWVDKTGKDNQVTAINFPLPMEARSARRAVGGQFYADGSDERKARLELEDRVRAALTGANEYSLQGFKGCNLQYKLSEKDSCGVETRVGVDGDNEMVWEAVVPFRAFYFKRSVTRAEKGRSLSICIETTGAPKPAAPTGSSVGRPLSSPGFSIGGMGVGVNFGGGYNGGRQPQQGVNITQSLYKTTKTWVKFGLAYP